MSDDLNKALQDANGNYYIHLYATDIKKGSVEYGRAKQLTQFDTIASQYKAKYIVSTPDGTTVEGLAQALNIDENELLEAIQNEVGEALQNELDIKALRTLHETVTEGDTTISGALKGLFDGKPKASEQIKKVNKALEIVGEALKLVEGGNEFLGVKLLSFAQNNGRTKNLQSLGGKLLKMVKDYEDSTKGKIIPIKQEGLQSAAAQLRNFGMALQSGHFSTGKDLTTDGLAKILRNGIVSTSIAETLGGVVGSQINRELNSVIKSDYSFKSTGTGTTQKDSGTKKVTNKTDILAENVKVSFLLNGEKNISLTINIGISSKFYTSQKFRKPDNTVLAARIGSGSGGNLKQAINELFPYLNSQYLIYNYLAHSSESSKLRDVNNYLLKRNIIKLFASAGKDDFAQFMLINGTIVSTWDIVKYALQKPLTLSSSESKGSDQAVSLSIGGRKDIIQANKFDKEGAWARSHKVNEKISAATIKAEMHLTKLLKAMEKI